MYIVRAILRDGEKYEHIFPDCATAEKAVKYLNNRASVLFVGMEKY